jgi:uncharacterized membrane protein YfcA
MTLEYSATGFIVGLIVGLTDVGGGALMTPLLLYFSLAFNRQLQWGLIFGLRP